MTAPSGISTRRPSTRAELDAIRAEPAALVYLTVDWSVAERVSRRVFADAVARIAGSCPGAGLTVWIVHDETDGFQDWWLEALKFSGGVVSGKGTVLWLRHGDVVWSVESAGAAGVESLIAITTAHFGC
jgi:hypothetical protein